MLPCGIRQRAHAVIMLFQPVAGDSWYFPAIHEANTLLYLANRRNPIAQAYSKMRAIALSGKRAALVCPAPVSKMKNRNQPQINADIKTEEIQ